MPGKNSALPQGAEIPNASWTWTTTQERSGGGLERGASCACTAKSNTQIPLRSSAFSDGRKCFVVCHHCHLSVALKKSEQAVERAQRTVIFAKTKTLGMRAIKVQVAYLCFERFGDVSWQQPRMCKFHILGACTKGVVSLVYWTAGAFRPSKNDSKRSEQHGSKDGCKFAHRKDELQDLPDLACTKLCLPADFCSQRVLACSLQ